MAGWKRTDKNKNRNKNNRKNEPKVEEEEQSGSYLSTNRTRRDGEEESSALWLITFTDVMALMLTFFVLLYSMSVPEEEDWKQVTQGMNNQFTQTFADQWSKGKQDVVNIEKIDFTEALDLGYLDSVLTNVIERDSRLQNINIIPQTDHLVVSVPQELLFNSGQAEVSGKGKQVLFALGNALTRIKNRIEIIGHSDPAPIERAGGRFASNWELSLARAGSVALTLENGGYERPMAVRGLSSSRYDDLPAEMGEEQRLSLARRVDIVVMKDDGSDRGFVEFDLPGLD